MHNENITASVMMDIPRSLTTDNKLNIIFGVFAVTTSTLSCLLSWAMWRIAYGQRGRRNKDHELPDHNHDRLRPQSSSNVGQGYELSFRIGRTA
ncbi:hypothetical protein BGZ60DRAFT_423569 [Tricladium varicosporioides]|nr:hypothetical protein BGZ60DRAFT_423569 [Hymenoscyphus varicosporioides]